MTERVRILVIDDESDVLDTISVALELAGFDVLAAADGSRGMALANAEHPAAILLDVQMPALRSTVNRTPSVLQPRRHGQKSQHTDEQLKYKH